MSPCCVVLSPNAVGSLPLSHLQQYEANSILLAALASLKGTACLSPAITETSEDVFAPLVELSSSCVVTTGTISELASYRDWVKCKIQAAAELASESRVWRESGVVQKLHRAMALVNTGLANKGREYACELLGFSQLKSLATSSLQLTCNPAVPSGGCNNSVCSAALAGNGTEFKVPALPAKRSRQQYEQLHVSKQQQQPPEQECDPIASHQQQQVQQRQPRKHSAPKRRATPQVLPAAPFVLGSAAAPDSSTHGETCCDESLLSCWCPISGKRQRSIPEDPISSATDKYSSSSSSGTPQQQLQRQSSPPSAAISSSAASSITSAAEAAPRKASPPAVASPVGGLTAAAAVQAIASASRSASQAEAVGSLTRLLHEDPSHSKPSSDVLLFNKAHQQPIHNWTGTIKHRRNGRVVELCKVTLQVPEPFLEEVPSALYAADIRHRRSVSLGRHVVCRATLGSVSEHQLAGLSAMARGQLVALCALQTAELHLVPYFDNKNLVRMVGFLKIKAE